MTLILNAAATIGIGVAAGIIGFRRNAFQGTTLTYAWKWAMAAIGFWAIATVFLWNETPDAGMLTSHAVENLVWYAAALVSLCPAVAVLGARRPGAGAWTWFVLMPLLAVLGWPVLTVWDRDFVPRPLLLETPQLIGFLLVLLMGAGNYVGTRFWASACLYAVALCFVVAPLSASAPTWLIPSASRALASILVGAAAILAARHRGRGINHSSPIDRLCDDYRNTFGIVWARRLQDRLNAVAVQQRWPVRFTPLGMHWEDEVDSEQREETTQKIEQSLRWMLRRFVDPEWIDQRLSES